VAIVDLLAEKLSAFNKVINDHRGDDEPQFITNLINLTLDEPLGCLIRGVRGAQMRLHRENGL